MKKGIFGAFGTNSAVVNSGVWVELPEAENEDGSVPSFLVARLAKGNKRYEAVQARLFKPHQRKIDLGTMPAEQYSDLVLDVFVESILLDWAHVKDENDVSLHYSKEKAKELMKAMPDLYNYLASESSNIANFQKEVMEDNAKN